jgi:hypothetical protein
MYLGFNTLVKGKSTCISTSNAYRQGRKRKTSQQSQGSATTSDELILWKMYCHKRPLGSSGTANSLKTINQLKSQYICNIQLQKKHYLSDTN